jgi:hypothetical protein
LGKHLREGRDKLPGNGRGAHRLEQVVEERELHHFLLPLPLLLAAVVPDALGPGSAREAEAETPEGWREGKRGGEGNCQNAWRKVEEGGIEGGRAGGGARVETQTDTHTHTHSPLAGKRLAAADLVGGARVEEERGRDKC